MRRCVIANQHTLFVSPERVTFGKLDPIRGYALLLQSSRCQFVEVRVAFLTTVPSANQTVVRQNDQRRATFTIKLRRPVSPLEISGRSAEDHNRVSCGKIGFYDQKLRRGPRDYRRERNQKQRRNEKATPARRFRFRTRLHGSLSLAPRY